MTNPFARGVTPRGEQLYTISAEDRIFAVRSFDAAQCNAALEVDGLQKTVLAAVQRRLRQIRKQERGGAA